MPKKIFNSDIHVGGEIVAGTLSVAHANIAAGVITASTLTTANITSSAFSGPEDGDLVLRADDSIIATIDYDEDSVEPEDSPAFQVRLKTGEATEELLVDANQYYTLLKGAASDKLILGPIYSTLRSAGNLELGIDTGNANSNEEFIVYRGAEASNDPGAVELFKVDSNGAAYIDSGDIRIFRSAFGTEFISQSKGIKFEVDEPEESALDYFSFSTSDETIATLNSEGLTLTGDIISNNDLRIDVRGAVGSNTGTLTIDVASAPQSGALTLLGIPQEASNPDTNSHDLTINALGQVQRAQSNQFTGVHLYKSNVELPLGSAVILTVSGEIAIASESNSNQCVGLVVREYLDPVNSAQDSLGNQHEPDRDYKLYQVAAVGDSRHKGCQGFNVCNENGDIQPGDLLVTSSTPGYLMKQEDDIIRAKTVGKAMESVTFDDNGQATGVYGFIYCG